MTDFKHEGLYFSMTAVEQVRGNPRRAPYKAALEALAALHPPDPVAAAVAAGFRYRFLGDEASATQAAALLLEHSAGLHLPNTLTYAEACAVTVALGHAFELVREQIPVDARRGWLHLYNTQVEALRAEPNAGSLLDRIWRTTVEVVGAIVLERGEVFVLAADDFRHIIDNDIHPEGYFPAIVEKRAGGALVQQVLAAKGLVLAAEAAAQQGVNLWGHEMRGISAKTAAIYAAAYYEYREQWPWDDLPDAESNDAFYQQNGAFLEMLNRQLRPGVLKATLDKLRPMFDPFGGGLTTLSHADPAPRGLFGLGG